MSKKYSKEIENIIVENYNKGKSAYWMVENIPELVGKRPSVIYGILKRLGVKSKKVVTVSDEQRIARRKYKVNDSYFKVIDSEEKAYWLGFLMADGYLAKGEKVGLALATVDIDHLEKFNKSLNSNYPIKTYNQTSGYSSNTVYSRVLISSKELYGDLSKYGMLDKTYSAKFPYEIQEDLYFHFIRGMFDGDGCITTNCINKNGTTSYSIKLTGTTEIIESIKNLFNVNVKNEDRWKERDNNNISITIGGNIQATRVLDLLYKDSTIYLERKYNLYLKVKTQNCRST